MVFVTLEKHFFTYSIQVKKSVFFGIFSFSVWCAKRLDLNSVNVSLLIKQGIQVPCLGQKTSVKVMVLK